MDRRNFICTGATLTLFSQAMNQAFAAATDDSRFILVILRGGLDGLAAVPPYGDSRYTSVRGQLALAEPGSSDAALKLDGLFGLHPALPELHRMYAAQDLAIVHAVASPYRDRSHFDGQKILEAGGTSPSTSAGGWLNRALASMLDESFGRDAIAVGETVPLVLRGAVSVGSWSPSRLPEADGDVLARVRRMYESADPEAAGRLTEALHARDLVDAAGMANDAGNARQLVPMASAAGRLLAADDGPRIAVLDGTGWDTHANQGAANGVLATRLRQLDTALANIRAALGEHWSKTTIAVVTEFGRTVAVNGTRGTDHGTASVAFVAGGAVAGGRVIGDWPGLADRDLYQGRDLAPTTDLRAVFKGILREQYGLSAGALETAVFPDSRTVPPLSTAAV